MTIERPMFPPVDPTRRHLLTVAAGAAVAGLIPTDRLAAAPAVDPVFELIEIHRKAHIAHMAALKLQNSLEERHGAGQGSWLSTQPCHDEDDAFRHLSPNRLPPWRACSQSWLTSTS